jgi:hypothetical protein
MRLDLDVLTKDVVLFLLKSLIGDERVEWEISSNLKAV